MGVAGAESPSLPLLQGRDRNKHVSGGVHRYLVEVQRTHASRKKLRRTEYSTSLYPKELFNSLSILSPMFSFIPSSSQSLINLTMIEYLLHVRYCLRC